MLIRVDAVAVATLVRCHGRQDPMTDNERELSVRFPKAGSYRFICTVPGHAAAGMKGVLKVR